MDPKPKGWSPDLRDALKRVSKKLFDKEELPMAKKRVKFEVLDGIRPVLVGSVLGLKAPMQLNLKPRSNMTLNLGVICDHALLVFEKANLRKQGIHLLASGIVCDEGTNLVVILENRTDSMVLIERGDTVARATVLDDTDVTIEVE